MKTGSGAHDFLDITARMLQVTSNVIDDTAIQARLGGISGKLALVRDAFALFEFGEAAIELIGHVSDLTDALDMPSSDPLREAEVARAVKQLTKNGLGLACSGSDAMMFLDGSKIVPLSPDVAQTFEGVFWISLGVLSGWDLVDQVEESDRCQIKSREAHSPQVRDYYTKMGEVANIRLVKDVAAVAMAALSLIAMFFANLSFMPTVMLGLACVYVVLKVASYFYQRVIDDQHALLHYAYQGKF
jgi:hypothetical protein